MDDDSLEPVGPTFGELELEAYTSSLSSIRNESWRNYAKCASESPELWDVDFYATAKDAASAAGKLCAGCPVIESCAASAMKPILGSRSFQSGVIVGGVALVGRDSRHELAKVSPDIQFGRKYELTATSKDKVNQMVELRGKGWKHREIAQALGVGRSTVTKALNAVSCANDRV